MCDERRVLVLRWAAPLVLADMATVAIVCTHVVGIGLATGVMRWATIRGDWTSFRRETGRVAIGTCRTGGTGGTGRACMLGSTPGGGGRASAGEHQLLNSSLMLLIALSWELQWMTGALQRIHVKMETAWVKRSAGVIVGCVR